MNVICVAVPIRCGWYIPKRWPHLLLNSGTHLIIAWFFEDFMHTGWIVGLRILSRAFTNVIENIRNQLYLTVNCWFLLFQEKQWYIFYDIIRYHLNRTGKSILIDQNYWNDLAVINEWFRCSQWMWGSCIFRCWAPLNSFTRETFFTIITWIDTLFVKYSQRKLSNLKLYVLMSGLGNVIFWTLVLNHLLWWWCNIR